MPGVLMPPGVFAVAVLSFPCGRLKTRACGVAPLRASLDWHQGTAVPSRRKKRRSLFVPRTILVRTSVTFHTALATTTEQNAEGCGTLLVPIYRRSRSPPAPSRRQFGRATNIPVVSYHAE